MKKYIISAVLFICFIVSFLVVKYNLSNKANTDNNHVKVNTVGETKGSSENTLSDKDPEIEKQYDLAKLYIKKGKYGEAEKELIELIAIKPDYYDVNAELSSLYKMQNRMGDAYKIIRQYYDLSKDEKAKVDMSNLEKAIKKNLSVKVTPKGGTLHIGDYITVTDSKGYDVYYTLDGKIPNKSSKKLEGKIEANKEGKLELKLIVVDDNDISSEVLKYDFDIKSKEVALNSQLQKKLNIFMSNFSEVGLISFSQGKTANSELVKFGYWHNFRNNYYKGRNLFEEAEDYKNKINKKYISEAVKKYFNISTIKHESLDYYGIEYKDGYYYQPLGDGDNPIDYSVVYKVTDIGSNEYKVYCKNYHTSEYASITELEPDSVYYSFNLKTADDIYRNYKDEYTIELVEAKVKKIKENGSERYILLEYIKDNKVEKETKENEFTEDKAAQYLANYYGGKLTISYNKKNGSKSYTIGNSISLGLSEGGEDLDYFPGLKYYSFRTRDLELVATGGTGTIDNGFIFENGKIVIGGEVVEN